VRSRPSTAMRERIADLEIGRADLRRAGGMVFNSGSSIGVYVSCKSNVHGSGERFGLYHVSPFWEVAPLQLPKNGEKNGC
jgi:hypothetical protein